MAEPEGATPPPAAPKSSGLEHAWRQAMDAHARYYEAWGQLASRWVRDLAEVSRSVQLPKLPPLRLSTTPGTIERGTATVEKPPVGPAGTDPPPAPVLVLEGVAADKVSAAFLVENSLPHAVDGSVEVGPFEDADGATAPAKLDFEPAAFTLSPGERRLVRVSLTMPKSLPPNVDCRSTIRVPGVPGTTIPVLLRRLVD